MRYSVLGDNTGSGRVSVPSLHYAAIKAARVAHMYAVATLVLRIQWPEMDEAGKEVVTAHTCSAPPSFGLQVS